jgi:hypothetical protein
MSTAKGHKGHPVDAIPIKGTVVAQPAEMIHQGAVGEIHQGAVGAAIPWPVELFCFDNCNICADLPLCCYASHCQVCLWAEVAAHLQVNTLRSASDAEVCAPSCCCTSRRRATNCWVFLGYYGGGCVLNHLCQAVGCPIVIMLTPFLTMRSRQHLESQGLEVECGHAYCADCLCIPCSKYQQAVYVKHVRYPCGNQRHRAERGDVASMAWTSPPSSRRRRV